VVAESLNNDDDPEVDPVWEEVHVEGFVTGVDYVNIRQEPGTQHAIVGRIVPGTGVYIDLGSTVTPAGQPFTWRRVRALNDGNVVEGWYGIELILSDDDPGGQLDIILGEATYLTEKIESTSNYLQQHAADMRAALDRMADAVQATLQRLP